jgi:hypothetical protein
MVVFEVVENCSRSYCKIWVKMGVIGMEVEPAGKIWCHHLIIDGSYITKA